eukprot:10976506-Lingulodinium_polyedra.AAC.1
MGSRGWPRSVRAKTRKRRSAAGKSRPRSQRLSRGTKTQGQACRPSPWTYALTNVDANARSWTVL